MQALDFGHYQIAMMPIEHSMDPVWQKMMRDLLLPKGYRVLQRHQDDWLYHLGYLAQLQLAGEVFDAEKAFAVVLETFPH